MECFSFITLLDKTSSENDSDNESSPESTGGESRGPRCLRTGLYFPTTDTLQLLSEYDDGIEDAPSVAPITGEDGVDEDDIEGEPVFCRICREGLHDVDYDLKWREKTYRGHHHKSVEIIAIIMISRCRDMKLMRVFHNQLKHKTQKRLLYALVT